LPAKRGYRAKEMLSSHTFAASDVRQLTVTKIAYGAMAPLQLFPRCNFDAAAPKNERRVRP
jgi:hypothetical protein